MRLRWFCKTDLVEVLDVQFESITHPLPLEKLSKKHNVYGRVVADKDELIFGYCFYQISRKQIRILELAVHPRVRRRGLASTMLSSICKSAERSGATIRVEVPEVNLPAQLLFKAAGFRATAPVDLPLGCHYVMQFTPASVPAVSGPLDFTACQSSPSVSTDFSEFSKRLVRVRPA